MGGLPCLTLVVLGGGKPGGGPTPTLAEVPAWPTVAIASDDCLTIVSCATDCEREPPSTSAAWAAT